MLWTCTDSCLQSFETISIFFGMCVNVMRVTALITSGNKLLKLRGIQAQGRNQVQGGIMM